MTPRFDLPAIGPATAIAFPRPTVHTLPNGLTVQAIPWPAVPVVAVALVLPDGAAADPADRPGLTGLVADMLDEGAGSRDTVALADAFARLGARFDIEVGSDSTMIGLTALARHATPSLSLLADIVFRPHLEQDALERVRDLRLSRLKQLSQTPAAPADRAFLKAVFGDGPYGHGVLGTTRVLEAVTLDEVRQRWRESWRPDRATLIVAGDVDPAAAGDIAMAAGLGTAIAAPVAASRASSPAITDRGAGPVIWLVDRPGAPQSEVRVGHLGPARNSPDYHALIMLQYARLMTVVEHHLGHDLLARAEAAKIAVAEGGATRIDLGPLEPGLASGLDEAGAVQALDGELQRIADAAGATLRAAGVRASQVDVLYFTGGSTGFGPLVQRIAAGVPAARVIHGDRHASVAQGLGVHAQRLYRDRQG